MSLVLSPSSKTDQGQFKMKKDFLRIPTKNRFFKDSLSLDRPKTIGRFVYRDQGLTD